MIRFEHIHKSYNLGNTRFTALDNLSLDVSEGEFLALAGPSGSGKTTLLNLAGCIDKPDSGRIWIDGEEVTDIALSALARKRRSRLGFVFQSFNLIPVLTAFENVEYPLMISGMPKRERQQWADSWLERVGLASHAKKRPDQLSGGQRQRVAIARAMVGAPAVVIADEPTANLDSVTTTEVLDLLQQINRETATTFLLATHDPLVMERASRTVHMRDGRIVSIEQERPALAC
ncbi:MAG TPA: ABC transporter ATP-binding protein [Bryobacteraceae bacterium]|jgi:putative ABC transport system ATP-binding protein|nr:ABC transporter ATP-binding protein [Bryobacteraceae bacterium]